MSYQSHYGPEKCQCGATFKVSLTVNRMYIPPSKIAIRCVCSNDVDLYTDVTLPKKVKTKK